MAFVKLFSTITESSLWSESKDTRLLFVTMLAKADASGFVEASLPGLARVANLTMAETESALARLEGPDKHSKSPDYEGRRVKRMDHGWLILNYQVYRERRNEEERQAYMRDYMKRYRAESVNSRKQMLANVNHGKPPLAQAEAEAEAEAEVEEHNTKDMTQAAPADDSFLMFWEAYELKKGKPAAMKAWKRLSKADRDAAIEGIAPYRRSISDKKYQRHPATYLNKRTWDDEHAPAGLVCPHPPGTDKALNWWALNMEVG
jgi:hypothetical protein